jgi:hypothetical protein
VSDGKQFWEMLRYRSNPIEDIRRIREETGLSLIEVKTICDESGRDFEKVMKSCHAMAVELEKSKHLRISPPRTIRQHRHPDQWIND